VAPGGKGDVPLGSTPTGFGSVMPKAAPTVAAVGHELGAAVVVGSTGEVEATGDGDPAVVPPHAARAAVKTSMATINRPELLRDTCNASFTSHRLDAIWLSPSFQPSDPATYASDGTAVYASRAWTGLNELTTKPKPTWSVGGATCMNDRS
jgi:hypothetical protein